MRITQNIVDRNMLQAVNDNLARLATIQTQLATGRRIITFSDDPVGASQVLRLERENERLSAYRANAATIRTLLDAAANSVQQASESLARAKELAVQAATGTYSDSDRQSLAEGVDYIIEGLVSIANVKSKGRYVFSGQATADAPYAATRDSDGRILAVAYCGDPLATEIEVGPDLYAEANLVGREFFEGRADLFGSLIALRDAIRGGDQASIRDAMAALEGVHGRVAQALGRLGERMDRMRVLEATCERFQGLNEERLAETRDADIAALSIDYNSRTALLQIVMKLAAEATQPSLADYL